MAQISKQFESIGQVQPSVTGKVLTQRTSVLNAGPNPQVNPIDKNVCTGGGGELQGVEGDGGSNVRYRYLTWDSDQYSVTSGTGMVLPTIRYGLRESATRCLPLYDY